MKFIALLYKFIIFVLSFSFVYSKIYFYFNEGILFKNILCLCDCLISIVLVILLNIFTIKEKANKRVNKNVKKPNGILVLFMFITIGISFFINGQKKVVGYDAAALYDSRAKFMLSGYKFSMMPELMKYNSEQKSYYGAYPPYTTLMHFFWYLSDINLPVSLLYSLFLSFLFIICLDFCLYFLNYNMSIICSLFVVIFPNIFDLSLIEYTNLPYTLVISIVLFGFYKYIFTKKWQNLITVSLFLSFSQWIRFTEPIWFILLFAFGLFFLLYKQWRQIFIIFLILLVNLIAYLNWNNFSTSIMNANNIFTPNYLNMVSGLINGEFLNFCIFVVKKWYLNIFYFLFIAINIRHIDNKWKHPFYLILLSIFSFYFCASYYLSYATWDWKNVVSDSVIRSITFLVPLSFFLFFLHIKRFFRKP